MDITNIPGCKCYEKRIHFINKCSFDKEVYLKVTVNVDGANLQVAESTLHLCTQAHAHPHTPAHTDTQGFPKSFSLFWFFFPGFVISGSASVQ